MSNNKDIARGKVMKDFELMANLALDQLKRIENLLLDGELTFSAEMATTFKEDEKKIDDLEIKLNDRIIKTIVLYKPVASEIRQIISAYRIVISIERIGDHAVKLVDHLSNIKSLKVYNELSDLVVSMFKSSIELVEKALLSFVQHDLENAKWVIKNSSEIGNLNNKTLKNIIDKSKEFDEKKKVITSFITIKEMIDQIERIADHSENIAESTIYFLEGKDVRHIPYF